MDSTTNPTPTPNPASGVPPVPPVSPNTPATPPQPAAPVAPINPVINPTAPAAGPVPANPVFQPGGLNGMAATDPIMQPEPAPAPDPIEEELKAPMKAAAPVPGSIGSAVSGPEATEESPAPEAPTPEAPAPESLAENPFTAEAAGSTPSVSFTDPATQPDTNPAAEAAKPAKKKTSKNTLIALVVVAFMVVIALAAVLIFTLQGDNKQPEQPANPTPAPADDGGDGKDEPDDDGNDGGGTSSATDTITCTATQATIDQMTSEYGQKVKSNTVTLKFSDNKLVGVAMDFVVTDDDGVDAKNSAEYTVSQFFEQAGLSKEDLIAQGVQFDDEGNMIISKDEMLSVGLDGYTCVSPNQL